MKTLHGLVNDPIEMNDDGSTIIPHGLEYFQYTTQSNKRVIQEFYIETRELMTRKQVMYHKNKLRLITEKRPDFLHWGFQ